MTAATERLLQQAIAAHRGGAVADAERLYRRVLSVDPQSDVACGNLAIIVAGRGDLDEAERLFRRAIAARPNDPTGFNNLGALLLQQGRVSEAIAAHRRALALAPDYAAAHLALGNALKQQGQLDEALASFRQAIRCKPDHAEAYFNLGVTLQQKSRLEDALSAYQRVIALDPRAVTAIGNAGVVLQQLGRLEDALQFHCRALALDPTYGDAHNNVGAALLALERPDAALSALRQALAHKPDDPRALYNAGNALRELGRLDEAIAAYAAARRLRPDDADAFFQLAYHRWRACDWTDYDADQEKLLAMVRGGGARVPPFYLLSTPADAADQLACARQWAEPIAVPPSEVLRHPAPEPRERIRLGYLSGDFHQHATAHLAAALFAHHDRARFEVFAYSYGPDDGSAMRTRLMRAFDRFTDIRALSHRQAAQRIHADRVDILIDLKGYTHRARPRILAHRPAPIQVSYLGYPATMGADFIDYLIADSFVAPASEQEFFSERLVHLPGCYQVNDPDRAIAPLRSSRQDHGLPREGVVLCCFNNSYKIAPALFDVWMRLLAGVPGAVLWLLAPNPLVERNLRQEAGHRGVDPGRLIFAPPLPLGEHLARHRHADLFLDTLPCNAHTTASDALWAGLPVLTCAGPTFAGRVAGSLLTAIGLPELITRSLQEYEQTARALALARDRLAALREKLEQNRGARPLFAIAHFTRNIEAAYDRMWKTWCAGGQPMPFAVEATRASEAKGPLGAHGPTHKAIE
jgi:protein O-GlcNAc transferase